MLVYAAINCFHWEFQVGSVMKLPNNESVCFSNGLEFLNLTPTSKPIFSLSPKPPFSVHPTLGAPFPP